VVKGKFASDSKTASNLENTVIRVHCGLQPVKGGVASDTRRPTRNVTRHKGPARRRVYDGFIRQLLVHVDISAGIAGASVYVRSKALGSSGPPTTTTTTPSPDPRPCLIRGVPENWQAKRGFCESLTDRRIDKHRDVIRQSSIPRRGHVLLIPVSAGTARRRKSRTRSSPPPLA